MQTTRVQKILDQVGTLAFPGIYDTLSAKIAEKVGFPMAFVSGYSLAASTIGEPDFGQPYIGNIDRHKQQQEAGAAHGRDRLQRHEVCHDESQRSGNQGAFKMLATNRPFESSGQLAGLGDNVGQAPGAVKGRVYGRARGHQCGNRDGNITGPTRKILSRSG